MVNMGDAMDLWQRIHRAITGTSTDAAAADAVLLEVMPEIERLRARLAAVEACCREALDQNRPPHATNSEVVWLVGDIRTALTDPADPA